MRSLIILVLIIFSFAFIAQEEKRLALVIGNANYEKGALKNPVNDALLIAKTLESLNFDVILKKNLKYRSDFVRAVREFGVKRNNYDVAFVYYAGHGIQVDNENFLIPTREKFDSEDDVIDFGVSVQNILRYLESESEKVNVLILDACRDNPFEINWNSSRSLKGNGLAKIPAPIGSLIAFSTGAGNTAADGEMNNSIYCKSLCENLMLKNTTIGQIFRNVRSEVLKYSNGKQTPEEVSKLVGQAFYLKQDDNLTPQNDLGYIGDVFLKSSDTIILLEKEIPYTTNGTNLATNTFNAKILNLKNRSSLNKHTVLNDCKFIVRVENNEIDPHELISVYKFQKNLKKRIFVLESDQVYFYGLINKTKTHEYKTKNFKAEKYGLSSYIIEIEDLIPGSEYGISLNRKNEVKSATTSLPKSISTFSLKPLEKHEIKNLSETKFNKYRLSMSSFVSITSNPLELPFGLRYSYHKSKPLGFFIEAKTDFELGSPGTWLNRYDNLEFIVGSMNSVYTGNKLESDGGNIYTLGLTYPIIRNFNNLFILNFGFGLYQKQLYDEYYESILDDYYYHHNGFSYQLNYNFGIINQNRGPFIWGFSYDFSCQGASLILGLKL